MKTLNPQNQLEDKDFCRQFIRANNAIEGLFLSDDDKKFMDTIDPNISDKEFESLLLARLDIKGLTKDKVDMPLIELLNQVPKSQLTRSGLEIQKELRDEWD